MKLLLTTLLIALLPTAAACQTPRGPVEVTGEAAKAKGWKTETVVSGLEHPWSLVWLPDRSILVTERPGRLRIVKDGALLAKSIVGLPEVFARGQGGLMDVSLHPKFEENSLIYLSYSAGSSDSNATTLAGARLVENSLEDFKVLYQVPHRKSGTSHFGSRIAWLADGTLLLSVGDGGNPPTSFEGQYIRTYAQDLSKAFGKILRFADDGSIPSDNPFYNQSGALKEIYSYGHRNIQGLYVDLANNRVWANEHGSKGGDELNLILPGKNYGWPVVSYSREYHGPRVSDDTSKSGMEDPKVVWTPSKAPSGLTLYSGNSFPAWQGALFSGALAGQEVRKIALKGSSPTGQETLDIGMRVRDIRQGPDDELYLLTDSSDGKLLKIIPE